MEISCCQGSELQILPGGQQRSGEGCTKRLCAAGPHSESFHWCQLQVNSSVRKESSGGPRSRMYQGVHSGFSSPQRTRMWWYPIQVEYIIYRKIADIRKRENRKFWRIETFLISMMWKNNNSPRGILANNERAVNTAWEKHVAVTDVKSWNSSVVHQSNKEWDIYNIRSLVWTEL